jgi:hypothetical protein
MEQPWVAPAGANHDTRGDYMNQMNKDRWPFKVRSALENLKEFSRRKYDGFCDDLHYVSEAMPVNSPSAEIKPFKLPKRAIIFWVQIITVFALVSTLFCVYRQTNYIQGQLTESQIATEMESRPWVFPADISYSFNTNDSTTTFTITLNNTGRTPAMNVQTVELSECNHQWIYNYSGNSRLVNKRKTPDRLHGGIATWKDLIYLWNVLV